MFDLDAFLDDCRSAATEPQPTLAIKEVLQRALSDRGGIRAALGDPGPAEIGVLYAGEDVTVLRAVWAPCMSLAPHNHNMPALIGIYGGREQNTFWRRERCGLALAGGRELQEREVAVMGPEVIHSVDNPCRSYTAAVHVYLGDYLASERSEWDPQTYEERPFDIETSRRRFADAEAAWRRQSALDARAAARA